MMGSHRSNMVPVLDIQTLSKDFSVNGTQGRVLEDLSFSAMAGDFICILGQSGCGKSTLLKLLAGFLAPSSGHILFKGNSVISPGPERCVVFQEDTLFPWLTVQENIGFGLKKGKMTRGEIQKQVDRFLDLTGLARFWDYLPRDISGGMKQRVALARVLVLNPEVLLMDEPFAALDAQTRERMQDLLLSLWQELGQTIIFVTHDVTEAVTLSDRTMVMDLVPGNFTDIVAIDLERPRGQENKDFLAVSVYLRSLVAAS